MRVAIILEGTRVGRLEIPWLDPNLFEEIANGERKDPTLQVKPYVATWKKVGNEYRIYYVRNEHGKKTTSMASSLG